MLTVLAAVAQMEREMMLERQREGIAAAKAAGRIAKRGNGKAIDRAGNCCRSREWWLNSERSKRFQCQHADGATYQERAGGVMPPDI